ncbi:hypothetical protein RND81_11G129300 [Saponaria officinalis]|uniref:PX domain-containing protein n=1 Tax=Saponaria officinalis TaxID=3572 RepID=A0AAW1HLD0_SAPOF
MNINAYGAYGIHPSFLEFGVPNEYILEALAHQYNNNNNHANVSENSIENPKNHRHDGTSPLPLGMDWSPPPSIWEGRGTVWPHEPHTGWSYCVTIPSWTILSDSGGSGSVVFYRVQVGIQTPEAVTTTRGTLHRFSDFLNLFSELKKIFPKKNLPVPPSRKLLGSKSKSLTEERRSSLEHWMDKLLSDIDISRSAPVAIFLELEAAVRSSFNESSGEGTASFVEHQTSSDVSASADSLSAVSVTAECTSISQSEDGTPSNEGHVDNKSIEGTVGSDSGGSDVNSPRTSEGGYDFNRGTDGPTNEELQFPSNLVMALPLEHRQKFSRFLVAMEQRLATAKADMEDLVARLNQEHAVRQFLTTKVTDLEVELETTTQSTKDTLEQAISTEKERFTQMQWDLEEFRKKYLELEIKLKAEQDEKTQLVSENLVVTEDNERLKQELQAAKNLQKQHEEAEVKSKTDLKVLVKEVKSLRNSQAELKQELNNVTKEKQEAERDVQNEKQLREEANSVNEKLLHECVVLKKRLQECSVNFVVEEEDKLTMDISSPSDAVDSISTSDNRIGLLLAEAQLLAQDVENAVTKTGRSSVDDLRKMITDLFVDNATLRKQINAVIRCSLKTNDKTEEEEGDEDAPPRTTVLSKYL